MRSACISCATKSPSEEGLDRKILEVAGVEGLAHSSQGLGQLGNTEYVAPKHTQAALLTPDTSGQILAMIVANWHRLPDDDKIQMARLIGLPLRQK